MNFLLYIMTEAIKSLNCKRRNIKEQVTRLSKYVSENKDLDIVKLEAQQDIFVKTKDKFEGLKEEYYKIVSDNKLQETKAALCEIEEDIQKIEV